MIDQRKFVDKEGLILVIDEKSDVELDGNDLLDLDLDAQHNGDNLESDLDLLSDSEDRVGSAEDFHFQ